MSGRCSAITHSTQATQHPMLQTHLRFSGPYPTGDYVDSSAAVVDGKVYFASQDFKVYCLNAETGPLIWSYMTGANMYSSPAIANGIMYVGSNDGTLYAFGSPQLRYFNDMFALNSVHG